MKPAQRAIKIGECLAMMSESVQSGPKGMWWDYYTNIPCNERIGDVSVVYVRGSLDHHAGYGCDSYEEIIDRVTCAADGSDVVRAARMASYWDDSVVVPEPVPPKLIVLRIDSPGGVVSGLNETVAAIRRIASGAGARLVAYLDEMAASAAYAIACACDEIVLPPSAIAGSVGVISTMCDQTAADKDMGLKFVTITSGTRKADGHPHVPISSGAVSAETARVNKYAKQFFKLVADSRPISAKKVAGYEAGIFVGAEAVSAGLADSVASWDELLVRLQAKLTKAAARDAGSPPSASTILEKVIAQHGTPVPTSTTQESDHMSLIALQALVTQTEASLASATDPVKRARLTSTLAAYSAALAAKKSEEDEEDDEEDEKKMSKAAKTAKGNETDRNEKKAAEEDDEESASANTGSALAMLEEFTGMKGSRALGAGRALLTGAMSVAADVAALKQDKINTTKATLIKDAVVGAYITKADAKWLQDQKLSVVEGFLSQRKSSGSIINTSETDLVKPGSADAPGTEASLPAATVKMIDDAVASMAKDVDAAKFRAQLVTAHLNAHRERMHASANGAGRY